MYTLAEYGITILMVVAVGGFLLIAVATSLIVVEGFNAKIRSLRVR